MYLGSKPVIYVVYLHICRSNATAVWRVSYVHVEKASHVQRIAHLDSSHGILRFELNRVPLYVASAFLPSRASSERLAKCDSVYRYFTLWFRGHHATMVAKKAAGNRVHAAPAEATGSAILVTWLPARMIFCP